MLSKRSLRHVLRSPDTIITTALTPIAMLLLFVHVLGGSGAGVLAWLAVLGLLLLFTLALSWVAVLPGLTARSVDGVSGSFPLLFLPFISSAFVPTAGMPGPVRWFADHQPVTSVVDTLRSLLDEQPVGGEGWLAVAWCLGVLVVAQVAAMLAYRRTA